jgi:TonB family protein
MQNWAMEVNLAIRKNWTLSKESPENICSLATTIRLRLLEDGTISELRIAKSSGNADFDEECMNALKLTDRVPPVPPSLAGRVSKIAITFAGKDLASCGPTSR